MKDTATNTLRHCVAKSFDYLAAGGAKDWHSWPSSPRVRVGEAAADPGSSRKADPMSVDGVQGFSVGRE